MVKSRAKSLAVQSDRQWHPAIETELPLVSPKERYAKLSELFQLPIDSIHTMFLNRHISGNPQEWKDLAEIIGGLNANH